MILSCHSLIAQTRSENDIATTLIKIFNKGDRVEVIDYLSKNMSSQRIKRYGLDAHVGVFLNSQNTYGKLVFVKKLPTVNNNEQVVVVSENNQLTYILNINRTKSKPYKINYFVLQDPEPIEETLSPITTHELTQKLSEYIQKKRTI